MDFALGDECFNHAFNRRNLFRRKRTIEFRVLEHYHAGFFRFFVGVFQLADIHVVATRNIAGISDIHFANSCSNGDDVCKGIRKYFAIWQN